MSSSSSDSHPNSNRPANAPSALPSSEAPAVHCLRDVEGTRQVQSSWFPDIVDSFFDTSIVSRPRTGAAAVPPVLPLLEPVLLEPLPLVVDEPLPLVRSRRCAAAGRRCRRRACHRAGGVMTATLEAVPVNVIPERRHYDYWQLHALDGLRIVDRQRIPIHVGRAGRRRTIEHKPIRCGDRNRFSGEIDG